MPPRPRPCPRELDAVEDLLKILINRRIDKLTAIKRAPLPQEPGGAGSKATSAAQQPGKPKPGTADLAGRFRGAFPVEHRFSVASRASFRDSLDDMVTSKRLFLVRAIQVKNQVQKGPPT